MSIGCSDRLSVETSEAPIKLTGHGQFFDKDGRSVEPTDEVVLQTQKVLISKWSNRLKTPIKFNSKSIRENYEVLDQLLNKASSQGLMGVGNDRQVSNAFRAFYDQDNDEHVVRKKLGTNATQEAYIEQCLANGVPVPAMVLSEDWTNHGTINNPFISTDREAELWSWESVDPDGICVALPRWKSDVAELFGIICLGRQTSKVCYFDNPSDHPDYDSFLAPRDSGGYSIENFIGGADLEQNTGGMCTDCHAGANPFIVHPEEPAFVSLKTTSSIFSASWPEPIVHPSWVQNPGPLAALPPSTTGASCESCHGPTGGRFPTITSALSGYCQNVLNNAINQTMPPYGGDPALYASHSNYLLSLCNNAPIYGPGSGTTVSNPPSNDVAFLSPPIVITPIYECSTTVGVRGARLNSNVDIYVNGSVVASDLIRRPSSQSFTVPSLSEGDQVWATQTFGGQTSGLSNVVIVKNYLENYPNGLPTPWVEPSKVHECAYNIAVRHVEGATLYVITNGGSPRGNWGGPTGWTVAQGDGPFGVGDSIEVFQELCGEMSNTSTPIFTMSEPSYIPAPQLDPPDVHDQQELLKITSIVEGSTIEIAEASFGHVGNILSWPVSFILEWDIGTHLGRPLQTGDIISIQQTLCTNSDETSIPVTKSCDDLEQPDVVAPIAGQDFIIISSAVPGASIRVYDSNGNEIGDGGGSIILLSRPLQAGESIVVVQEINEACTAQTGVSLVVNEGNGQPIASGGE